MSQSLRVNTFIDIPQELLRHGGTISFTRHGHAIGFTLLGVDDYEAATMYSA
jgi:hypothetical protein